MTFVHLLLTQKAKSSRNSFSFDFILIYFAILRNQNFLKLYLECFSQSSDTAKQLCHDITTAVSQPLSFKFENHVHFQKLK